MPGTALSLDIKDEQMAEGPAHAQMRKRETAWHGNHPDGSQEHYAQ